MNRKLRRAMKAIGLGKKEVDSTSAQDLAKQYGQACAEAGELQYKIVEFQRSLEELNDRIRKLNVAYAEKLAEQRAMASSKKGGEAPPASPSPQESK